jgi:hypothetical protein
MAQTPKSVSALLQVPLKTIYTAPSATNAVVKNITFVSPTTNNTNVYLYKTTGGVTYPVNYVITPFYQGSGSSASYGVNLLPAPITLNTGDSLSANTNTEVMPMLSSIQGLPWNNQQIFWQVNKYANGIWICAGNSNSSSYEGPNINLVTSTDGKTWTQIPFTNDFYPTDLIFGASNTWILVGYTVSGGGANGAYYYSTNNGSTWTYATISGATSYTTQCWYLNGYYFVCTANGQLFYSSNATTWTDTSLYTYQPNLKISGMAYLNSKYVVTTNLNGQFTTTNLSTWVSPYFVPTTAAIGYGEAPGVVYNSISSKFFTLLRDPSGTGSITTSTDGITWTPINTGFSTIFSNGTTPLTILNSGGTNNYLLICNDVANSIYSTNGGSTWNQANLNGSLPTPYVPHSLNNRNFIWAISNQFWITATPWSTSGTAYTLSGSNTFNDPTQFAVASDGTQFCLWYANTFTTPTWSKIYNTTNATTGASYNNNSSIAVSSYGIPVAGAYFNSYFYILSSNGTLFRTSTVSGSLSQIANNLFNGQVASMAVVGSRLVIWSTANNFGFKSSADGSNWETSYPNFYPSSYTTYSANCQSRLASNGSICTFVAALSGSSGSLPSAVTTNGINWNNLPAQTTGMTTVNSNTIQWIIDADIAGTSGIYTVTDASTPSSYSLINNNNSISIYSYSSYNQIAQAFYTNGKYYINGAISNGAIISSSLTINTFYTVSYGGGYNFVGFNNPNGLGFYIGSSSTPVLSSDGTTTVLIDLNSPSNYYFDIYQGSWANVEGGWVNLGVVEIS